MNSPDTDEIDLQQLAINIIKYFSRHYKFIILSTVTGLLLSFMAYLYIPPVYESKMLVMSDILTDSYGERFAENFHRLIVERNDSILAARLGITIEEAGAIKSIEIESVKKSNIEEKVKEPTLFIITAEVRNKKVLARLQDGLINFLRTNEFVNTRVRLREASYRIMIAKLDKEIFSLDSLKKRIFSGKSITSNSSEVMLLDPASIYQSIIDLNKLRLEYVSDLELADSIQLVEGFSAFKKPANPKLSVVMGIGLLMGFSAAIALLSLRKIIRLARQ